MKFWDYVNGRKTYVGTVLLLTGAVLTQVVVGIWGFNPDWMPKLISTIQWIGAAFGGVGFTHKAIKMKNQ